MIAQRSQLTFSVLDGSGSIGNMSLWLADGAELGTAITAADTFRGLVGPCTGAVFTRQAVVYRAVEVPRPSAAEGSDATRVGVFIFSTASEEFAIVEIAGILESTLMTTGDGAGLLLDTSNADIAALVAQLLSGLWSNPFGYQLLALEAAFVQIRR